MSRGNRLLRAASGLLLATAMVITPLGLGLPAGAETIPTQSAPIQGGRVAVLDFRAIGVPVAFAEAATESVRSALVRQGGVTVVERAALQALLREQHLGQSGLTDQRDAAELGRLVNATYVLLGSVAQVADTIILNARLVDVATGTTRQAAMTSTMEPNGLPTQAVTLARQLLMADGETAPVAVILPASSDRISKPAPVLPPPQTVGHLRPTGRYKALAVGLGLLAPGWGEFYAGEAWRGWLVATLATGGAVLMAVSLIPAPFGPGPAIGPQSSTPMWPVGLGIMGLSWIWGAVDAGFATQEYEWVPASRP
jgi:TolB-like protein